MTVPRKPGTFQTDGTSCGWRSPPTTLLVASATSPPQDHLKTHVDLHVAHRSPTPSTPRSVSPCVPAHLPNTVPGETTDAGRGERVGEVWDARLGRSQIQIGAPDAERSRDRHWRSSPGTPPKAGPRSGRHANDGRNPRVDHRAERRDPRPTSRPDHTRLEAAAE